MKKQYGKPDVTFESVSLSANIAGNCGTGLNYHSMDCASYATSGDPYTGGCVFVDNGYTVFNDVSICDVQPDGNSWSRVCYHVIMDEMKAFTS